MNDDDDLGFIDLDDCIDPATDVISDWAQRWIDQCAGRAIIAVSPLQLGLRIIGRFSALPGSRTIFKLPDGGQIEFWCRGKFTTITNVLLIDSASEPGTIQDLVDAHFAEYADEVAESLTVTNIRDDAPLSDDDEELIKQIRSSNQGAKFERLFDHGDCSDYRDKEHPKGNHSNADLGLCCILAFCTQRDASRMDRLFRRSAMWRSKWDDVHYRHGIKYGAHTIAKAIALTDTVYEPNERPQLIVLPKADRSKTDDEQSTSGNEKTAGDEDSSTSDWLAPLELTQRIETPRMALDLIPGPLAPWIADAAERARILPERLPPPRSWH